MNERVEGWTFGIGRLFGVPIRLSWVLVLLLPILVIRLPGFTMGLAFFGFYALWVAVHTFGHALAARLTGGYVRELSFGVCGEGSGIEGGPTIVSRLAVAMGGYVVHSLAVVAFLPTVLHEGVWQDGLNPFTFPIEAGSSVGFTEVCLINFHVNWLLLLLNLIPARPLDAAKLLSVRLPEVKTVPARRNHFGFAISIGLAIASLACGQLWALAISGYLALFNRPRVERSDDSETFDETFLGYDFSAGYTSLEQERAGEPTAQPNFMERWLRDRRTRRERRRRERDALDEQEIDRLLSKVHESGLRGLTESERRRLRRASARYRQQGDR
ncbi:M50 family metallopeptidase [Stratiformator vulcanicus]|uniref:Peptidase family M50 n=1 Tax=Stratiformator vulcanicus TaxID=2527980 RepID=A0A517R1V1_9PLAN|nr:M50 family metallopeptidase [Stratiformator vulcanicus]QDT37848.1 Peptidase family M50 [Stratiformator vulcanicus]